MSQLTKEQVKEIMMKAQEEAKAKEGFKGGRSGGSGSGSGSGSSLLSNSGMQFHTGAITTCSPGDTSFYCTMARIMSYIGWALMIVAILYVVYVFGGTYFSKAGKGVMKGFKKFRK